MAVGTAPSERQPQPLPSPDQAVAYLIDLGRQLGLDASDTVTMTGQIGYAIRRRLMVSGAEPSPWVEQVIVAAALWSEDPHPSITITQENDYGDGPGSRSGSAEQEQQ